MLTFCHTDVSKHHLDIVAHTLFQVIHPLGGLFLDHRVAPNLSGVEEFLVQILLHRLIFQIFRTPEKKILIGQPITLLKIIRINIGGGVHFLVHLRDLTFQKLQFLLVTEQELRHKPDARLRCISFRIRSFYSVDFGKHRRRESVLADLIDTFRYVHLSGHSAAARKSACSDAGHTLWQRNVPGQTGAARKGERPNMRDPFLYHKRIRLASVCPGRPLRFFVIPHFSGAGDHKAVLFPLPECRIPAVIRAKGTFGFLRIRIRLLFVLFCDVIFRKRLFLRIFIRFRLLFVHPIFIRRLR